SSWNTATGEGSMYTGTSAIRTYASQIRGATATYAAIAPARLHHGVHLSSFGDFAATSSTTFVVTAAHSAASRRTRRTPPSAAPTARGSPGRSGRCGPTGCDQDERS